MRTYKVLYELVKKELLTQELGVQNRGICRVITFLEVRNVISSSEEYKLLSHLNSQKPTKRNKYKKFTLGRFWTGNSYWWWTMDLEPNSREVRIKFLEAIISNLK